MESFVHPFILSFATLEHIPSTIKKKGKKSSWNQIERTENDHIGWKCL